MTSTIVKYPTKPIESWAKAKELRRNHYAEIGRAREEGRMVTTGSLDAFAGALAASCAVGDDIRRAVKFASAAWALACTKFGSIETMPKKAEIIQLLQRDDIDVLPRNP